MILVTVTTPVAVTTQAVAIREAETAAVAAAAAIEPRSSVPTSGESLTRALFVDFVFLNKISIF